MKKKLQNDMIEGRIALAKVIAKKATYDELQNLPFCSNQKFLLWTAYFYEPRCVHV
ncbi:hypothetical protein [Ureibacillus xyleni]|uniref:hypothetical protein n=1 Tax=Ureibacillus xyleni TaxID=614648 RepID=UPI00137B150B|nr:hypothetical protein [Ureibacillus xyleni]